MVYSYKEGHSCKEDGSVVLFSECLPAHKHTETNKYHAGMHPYTPSHYTKSRVSCIALVSIFPALGVEGDHAFKGKRAYFLGELFGVWRLYSDLSLQLEDYGRIKLSLDLNTTCLIA